MAKTTYYDTLGVTPKASEEEIKRAYRELAKEFHPDKNPSAQAENRFKEINRAYDILSDSLKRADYDHSLEEESYVKATATAAKTEEEGIGAVAHAPSKAEIAAATTRVLAHIFIFGVSGLALEAFLQYLFSPDHFLYTKLIPGTLAGIFFGAFWGADANFKVESFLGYGRIGRAYTFSRTVVEALTVGYFVSLIASYFDRYFYEKITWITPAITSLGVLVGATLGSDGDTIEKLQSGEGKFNLFYTALHGLAIGVIAGIIGIMLGLMLSRSGVAGAVFWFGFSGLLIGIIAGSIAPANLSAYASYVSASMRSVIITLSISAALLFGLVLGISAGPTIKDLLSVLFHTIFK